MSGDVRRSRDSDEKRVKKGRTKDREKEMYERPASAPIPMPASVTTTRKKIVKTAVNATTLAVQVQPPTPTPRGTPVYTSLSESASRKDLNPAKDMSSESHYTYRLGNADEVKKQRDEDLAEDIDDVGRLVGKLIHALRAYSFLSTQTKTQTLRDLKGVIESLPRPPRALGVRKTLKDLEKEVLSVYERKWLGWDTVAGCVLGSGSGCESHSQDTYQKQSYDLRNECRRDYERGLEGLWEEFLGLEEEQMRDMARLLGRGSLLMRIFDTLSSLRASSEELLVLDSSIPSCIKKDFENILAELIDFDGIVRQGGEGEGEGVMKGLGVSVGGSASMQWRVLGIVSEKRRGELEGRMEVVKRTRGEVSGALLGVVEGLCES